jgi:hypothetical protein
MRVSQVAFILLWLCILPQLWAGMSVADYRKGLSSRDETIVSGTKLYIKGVGLGMVIVNTAASRDNKQLFCQPNKLALETQNFLNILNGTIKALSMKTSAAKVDAMEAELVLFMGLQQTFPCSK